MKKSKQKFTIERGIPIEKLPIAPMKREPRYPFKQMQIGDSFFIQAAWDTRGRKMASKIRIAAISYAKRNPDCFFSILKAMKDGATGYRVFRIAATSALVRRRSKHSNKVISINPAP